MHGAVEPAIAPPTLARPSGYARAAGGVLTVLVHLLVAWALLAPSWTMREEPAALPPMHVSLLAAAAGFATPSPMETTPVLPEPVLIVPELHVAQAAPPVPLDEVPIPPATSASTAPPASTQVEAGGTGPQLRRSDGRAPDCQLPAWLALLSQSISWNLHYPADARQLGARGTAYVRLSITRAGHVMESPLLQSSGHVSLDYEARDVVRRIGRFAPVPNADCVGYDVIVVDQPIRFGG